MWLSWSVCVCAFVSAKLSRSDCGGRCCLGRVARSAHSMRALCNQPEHQPVLRQAREQLLCADSALTTQNLRGAVFFHLHAEVNGEGALSPSPFGCVCGVGGPGS